jgi:hypothetical protein
VWFNILRQHSVPWHWDSTVWFNILRQHSVPWHTETAQCGSTYWDSTVCPDTLRQHSVVQHTETAQCALTHWDSTVCLDMLRQHSVPWHTETAKCALTHWDSTVVSMTLIDMHIKRWKHRNIHWNRWHAKRTHPVGVHEALGGLWRTYVDTSTHWRDVSSLQ